VRLDFQQASQVTISGRLRTTSDTYVGPQPGSGLNAGEIKFYVTGSDGPGQPFEDTPKAARFGIRDTLIANVDVPNGTLVLGQGVEATGAFWGLRVRTEPNVKLTLEGGFGDCQVPAAPADVSIAALNPSDAQLAWTSRAGYDGAHDVWQSPSPYFRPGEAGSKLIGDDVSSPFVAPGVLGDPSVNHYFLVVADGVCSISAPSRLTGEFDFALAPGR